MNFISKRIAVLAIIYFISLLAVNKYFFEEVLNNKSIVKAILSTLFFCLYIYFLNRKKSTSKDN